jgi:hypothetical protein
MAQHDPINMPSSNPPARPGPRVAENISIYPPEPSNGGSIKTDGKTVENIPGPYSVEVPRVRRDV